MEKIIPPSCLTYPIWNRLGIHNHHGIAISLYSLHSKSSPHFGTFFSLQPLIDFCVSVGMDTIQLLPLNDSGDDPSPYNALSSCALDPLYISTDKLPFFSPGEPTSGTYLEKKQKKMLALYNHYEKVKGSLIENAPFSAFKKEHPWLTSYALFKTLKELHQGKCFWEWALPFQKPTPTDFENYLQTFSDKITFYIYLQYLCFEQLSAVKAYAQNSKVLLFGDLPILISPDSSDVWAQPSLFDRNLVVGAPPDSYNKEGQKWGFFPFRFDVLQKIDFAWWKERLFYASHFYDLYRIDHVVGLFRLWVMPPSAKPKEGFYIPKEVSLWFSQGREILVHMIQASSMLPIAEDLGTIPNGLRELLQELGICTTKLIRWERNWEGDKKFIPPDTYPPMSLTTVSTHDSEPLALWWKDHPDEAKLFAEGKKWVYHHHLPSAQEKEMLFESHHSRSLFHINLLQEYLRLFPDLSYPSLDEDRINIPGKVLPSNWTYQLKPSLEEICSHEGLKKLILSFTSN